MEQIIYLLPIISLIISFILYIPFINLLYKVKFVVGESNNKVDLEGKATPIFNKLHANKVGTPIGGGILMVLVTIIFAYIIKYAWNLDFNNVLFCFIAFGILGLYDDIKKLFKLNSNQLITLRARTKFAIQIIISSYLAYYFINNFDSLAIIPNFLILTNPILIFGIIVFLITFYTNAYNISDGLDGLSIGLMVITLIPILIFLYLFRDISSFTFLMILLGSALAYLYFNIRPARIFLGDAGALAFGATLAYVFILNDVIILLPIIMFMYTVICMSSAIQILSKKFRGKKIFLSAPLHHHFQAIGWEETKVVERFWVIQMVASLLSVSLIMFLYL